MVRRRKPSREPELGKFFIWNDSNLNKLRIGVEKKRYLFPHEHFSAKNQEHDAENPGEMLAAEFVHEISAKPSRKRSGAGSEGHDFPIDQVGLAGIIKRADQGDYDDDSERGGDRFFLIKP